MEKTRHDLRPMWSTRFTPEQRELIEALKANLKPDHGPLTTANVVRLALHSFAQFRGVTTV